MAACEDWWSVVNDSSDQIVRRHYDETQPFWQAMENYASYAMMKRLSSQRQVFELMAEFWEDHFYIPRHDDGVWPYRAAFGKTIRGLALTSFEELLKASTVHPAMGVSLDNSGSRKTAVNENLGRELLELHTVGQGEYTEADVKASSRMLTGFRVKTWSTWEAVYEPSWHYVGALQIMDFTHSNGQADGRAAVDAYLTYLARHPSTARRVALKLARRFVSDTPSEELVSHLASVYLAHGTEIKPLLRALVAHDEFLNSSGKKVMTPTDEILATYRALGTGFQKPTQANSGANTLIWTSSRLGATPWGHPRPDGPSPFNDAWTSPSRFLGSWEAHWGAAGGWWPVVDTTWKAYPQWLPQASITLDKLVDHLSRTLLGVGASLELLEACYSTTGYTASTVVTKSHGLANWRMPWLLSLTLNQPAFYLR